MTISNLLTSIYIYRFYALLGLYYNFTEIFSFLLQQLIVYYNTTKCGLKTTISFIFTIEIRCKYG